MIQNIITIGRLHEYFRENVGPLFCYPTANLLHRYRKMTGMVGIVHPITDGHLFKIDWSIDKDWKEVSAAYMQLDNDNTYTLSDVTIPRPDLNTIPQIVDDRCKFDWRANKQGQVVCIGDIRWANYKTSTPSRGRLEELKSWIGVIIDKCDTIDEFVTVTFFRQGFTKTTNVPPDMLVRLPKVFRPKTTTPHNQDAAKAEHKKLNTGLREHKKAKYAAGDVVVASPASMGTEFLGLIGVIDEVEKTDPVGDYGVTTYKYVVNFDTLPTRNLSLIQGEGLKEICIKKRLGEYDIKKWDASISDRGFITSFRVHGKRDRVWSLEHQKECKIETKSDVPKSYELGIQTKIHDVGGKRKITCRDMDYIWDEKGLINTLATTHSGLGLERDARNPNKVETRAYIYVFEFGPDVGKYVKYRIYLGSLLKQPSKIKKFEKALKKGKIRNPFQVRRYLKLKSLGYFYQIFTAAKYGQMVSDFAGVEV